MSDLTRDELLTLLIEECGEVIQAATKIMRPNAATSHAQGNRRGMGHPPAVAGQPPYPRPALAQGASPVRDGTGPPVPAPAIEACRVIPLCALVDGMRKKEMMEELIARLEKATEGSRELSAEVWCFLHGARFLRMGSPDAFKYEPANKSGLVWGHALSRKEMVTESIDAALTLLPEGFFFTVESASQPWPASASVYHQNTPNENRNVIGKSPALALCIAALRARALPHAHDKGQDNG